jgi:membrane dipeptidase
MRFQTQVNFVPEYVAADPTKADLKTVAEHVEHIASVIGRKQYVSLPLSRHAHPATSRADLFTSTVWWDSVGLGSDYDGIDSTINGLEDVSTFPALVRFPVPYPFTSFYWC